MGSFLSVFSRLFGKKEFRVLILGLDGAGKTTILYRLHGGQVVQTIPTIGFNVETLEYQNVRLQVWDLGGQTSIRPYWRCYYSRTTAIVFVVDSNDKDRIATAKNELMLMLEEEELKDAVLVILANKQDLPTSAGVTELANSLSLSSIRNRTYQIFRTSALTGEGIDSAFKWLVDSIQYH